MTASEIFRAIRMSQNWKISFETFAYVSKRMDLSLIENFIQSLQNIITKSWPQVRPVIFTKIDTLLLMTSVLFSTSFSVFRFFRAADSKTRRSFSEIFENSKEILSWTNYSKKCLKK